MKAVALLLKGLPRNLSSLLSCNLSLLHVAKDLLNRESLPLALNGSITADCAVEVATLALKCLSHLFTWVPLTTVISPRLLASVFHFAGLGIPAVGK